MSLIPYTITALELNQADATASGKQVVVGASCSMFIQPADTVVLLYDDAAASNGSTAKTTGTNGQVTVYIQPGSYRVVANGISRYVQVGQNNEITTTELIASTGIYPADTVINTTGYTASADDGSGRWKQNGVTGRPVSQSPSQIFISTGVGNLLNDGNGNQWSLKSYPHNVHMLGAVGNGSTADKPIWEAYLNVYALVGCSGIKGKVYALDGNLTLPVRSGIKDADFLQTNPSTDTRTLYSPSNVHCNLENVEVNRGTNKNGGSLANSAGFWIVGGVIRGRDISATGNGFGSGMSFHLFDDLIIYNPLVYDNFAGDSTTTALSDDVFQGFWLNRGEKAQVYALSVKNTTVEWTGQAPTTRFNRGVSVGGTKDFTFHGGIVDTVGQGWDFTGDQHTTRYSVIGAHANNCYSWGFKAANTATFGSYIGCHTYRADLGGFVASAPGATIANPTSEYTQNIVYSGCTATETGSVGNWTGTATIAGFRTGNTPTYPTYPQGIQWVNCMANSTTAAFGFFNEINRNTSVINNWVEESGCKSFGHTDSAFRGLNNSYLERRITVDQAITSGTATAISYDDTIYDGFNGATSLVLHTIRRDGIYTVSASAEFEGNALGIRTIQLYLNGAGGGPRRTSAPSVNGTTVSISHTQRFSEGTTIGIYVQQDSGSTLDVKSGQTTLSITGEVQAGRSV
ncbi:MAG: hypothetical protein ACJASL_000175 [Paraglaciecola sp.]|jgi:hypothetical protein